MGGANSRIQSSFHLLDAENAATIPLSLGLLCKLFCLEGGGGGGVF